MPKYEFDRYLGKQKMTQGATVHKANDPLEALNRARHMFINPDDRINDGAGYNPDKVYPSLGNTFILTHVGGNAVQ